MKFNNKTFGKVLLVALTIAFGFSMQSCEDQPDKYEHTGGKPTVYYIRPADVEAKDSLIVEGSPQMAIALVGENLYQEDVLQRPGGCAQHQLYHRPYSDCIGS